MEQPVRLTLHLTTGEEYWQRENPTDDAVIFDQVCVPYELIAFTYLTARATKGDDAFGFAAR